MANSYSDGNGQFLLPTPILADHQFLASATTKVVTGILYDFDGNQLYEATLTTTTTATKARSAAWTLTTGGAVLPWEDRWAGFEVLTTTATAYVKPSLGITATSANSFATAIGMPIGACPQRVYDAYYGSSTIPTSVYRTLLGEAIPAISSSTQIFANAPAGTKEIWISVRTQGITMTFDGTTAATASVVGHDFNTGASAPFVLSLNQTQALLVRAIQQAATAAGYITYRG